MKRILEHRLARLFGMDARLVAELLVAARQRDDGRLALRIAAFLAATAPGSRLLPRRLREPAIHSFVWWLFDSSRYDPRIPLVYAGHLEGLGPHSCGGMLRP